MELVPPVALNALPCGVGLVQHQPSRLQIGELPASPESLEESAGTAASPRRPASAASEPVHAVDESDSESPPDAPPSGTDTPPSPGCPASPELASWIELG